MAESGFLHVLNCGLGHMKLSFDTQDDTEVEKAKAMIQDMLKRGYTILIETEEGTERVKEFDPQQGEYLVEGIGGEKPKRRYRVGTTRATGVGRTSGVGRRAAGHRRAAPDH